MTRPLMIYGAGGQARESAWAARAAGFEVLAFVDDDASRHVEPLAGLPVLPLAVARERHPEVAFSVAVGTPLARTAITAQLLAGGARLATVIDPRAVIGERVRIGEGCLVCALVTLTCDIALGAGVHVNLHCSIAHDCTLDDFVTLAPGARISGNVHLERAAYVGTNAAIIQGRPGRPLRVGAEAVIGAGACVIEDVPPRTTVVGVPARPLASVSRTP